MENLHQISNEASEEIELALERNEHWMAYNNEPYHLGLQDVHFFKGKEDALEFVGHNWINRNLYQFVHFGSKDQAVHQIQYGMPIENKDLGIKISENLEPLINIPISWEAIDEAYHGIESGKPWLVYDPKNIFIDYPDLYQFRSKAEAIDFIAQNQNRNDHHLIHTPTIQDLFRQIPYGKDLDNIYSNQKTSVMNQENLKFLQDRLFYLGTEKRLYPELEKNLAEGKPDFKLSFSNHYDKDKLSAELHFRKSDTNDMYFLNKYEATLQKPGEESRSQIFYLDNGKGVMMKEAYNLLDGRSVNKDLKNKEGEIKNAWIKLDLSRKEPNGNYKQEKFYKPYGFDLHTELFKLPLPQMHAEKFGQMVESLQRGNKQQIRLPENNSGAVTLITIQANPQLRTLDIMDETGEPFSKAEKNDLYAWGELRNKMREEELSGATGIKIDPIVLFVDPITIQSLKTNAQKSENIAEKPQAEKTISPNQKEAQKTPPKALKKEKVESLLPKKQTSHKKGLAI